MSGHVLRNDPPGGSFFAFKSNLRQFATCRDAEFHICCLSNFFQICGKFTCGAEISEIAQFCNLKINSLLDANANTDPVKGNFEFDILKWIEDEDQNRLSFYKFENNKKQELLFEFSTDQLLVRNDVFKRYGRDLNAVSKIVTRIDSLESQFRKVRSKNENFLRDIYQKKIGDTNIRYTLSG